MNTLQNITGGLVSTLLPAVMSALLTVLGFILTFVASVWGVMRVYDLISGNEGPGLAYKMARIFGELSYEADYRDYAKRRDMEARLGNFEDRYQGQSLLDALGDPPKR